MTKNNFLKIILVSLFTLSLLLIYFFNAVKAGNFLLPLDIFSEYDPVYRVENYKAFNNLASDVLLQFLPYRAINDHFKTLTYWNPYSLGGVPFFEDIQARSLEISNVIATIIQIPLKYFFFFSAIFLLMFAGLSMYFFVKELKLSDSSAVFASIAFIFSSPVIIWINYTLGTTFIWLPFLFLTIEKIYNKRYIFLPIFSLAICFQLFAGHPQAAIINILFVSVYIIYRFFRFNISGVKMTSIIFIFLALGIGLSAFQTIPAFDYIRQSDVYQSGRSANSGSLSSNVLEQLKNFKSNLYLFKERLINRSILLLSPNHFGNSVERNYNYPEKPLFNNYFETSSYVGILVILLAAASLFIRRKTYFWLVSGVISFILFINLPFFNLLSLLPVVNKINLGRLSFIFVFSFIVLSAYGLDKMQSMAKQKVKNKKIGLLFFLVILLLFIDQYANFSFLVNKNNRSLSHFENNEIVKFLQNNQNFRFIAIGEKGSGIKAPLIPNQSMIYGINDLRGYFVMIPNNFFNLANKYLTRRGTYWLADDIFNNNFLNIYSVKYILCEKEICDKYIKDYPVIKEVGNMQILVNNQALPLAYISYNYKGYNKIDEVYRALENKDFDTTNTTLVEDVIGKSTSFNNQTVNVKYDKDKFLISAEARDNGILVLSDNYYPGWEVYVNGNKKNIVIVNGSIKGVEINKGKNEIIFEYKPRLFNISIIVSLFSFVLLICFYFLIKKNLPLKKNLLVRRNLSEGGKSSNDDCILC